MATTGDMATPVFSLLGVIVLLLSSMVLYTCIWCQRISRHAHERPMHINVHHLVDHFMTISLQLLDYIVILF